MPDKKIDFGTNRGKERKLTLKGCFVALCMLAIMLALVFANGMPIIIHIKGA